MKLSWALFSLTLATTNAFVVPDMGRSATALQVGWNLGQTDQRPPEQIQQELREQDLNKVAQLVRQAAASQAKRQVLEDLQLPLDKTGVRYKAADGSTILGTSQTLSASMLAMAPLILALNPPGMFWNLRC